MTINTPLSSEERKHAVPMNGLLIDTLVWGSTTKRRPFGNRRCCLPRWCSNFFTYLSELPKQEYWGALGSNQKVKVKKNFQQKAKKAVQLSEDAIVAEGASSMYAMWRKLFGRFVPSGADSEAVETAEEYRDTEKFVEDVVFGCLVGVVRVVGRGDFG
ncbi:hypothetical protein [Corynebacterium mayonis]|uniref:hypothetical protein n=1 Tax=Corynebacterium mayonis TaxID=3062461 RepID=UPI00313FE66E